MPADLRPPFALFFILLDASDQVWVLLLQKSQCLQIQDIVVIRVLPYTDT